MEARALVYPLLYHHHYQCLLSFFKEATEWIAFKIMIRLFKEFRVAFGFFCFVATKTDEGKEKEKKGKWCWYCWQDGNGNNNNASLQVFTNKVCTLCCISIFLFSFPTLIISAGNT